MSISGDAVPVLLSRAYDYMEKDPDKNIPKLVEIARKMDGNGAISKELNAVEKILDDKDGNWYKLLRSCWTDIDPAVFKRLFTNLVVNSCMTGNPRRWELMEKYDCNIPWSILMDPTSACNLHCTGCWAAEYGNKLNLTFDELDSIIEQGKALGIYFYLYTGGEPTMRKKDLIALASKHNDCVFMPFTNGTMIDDDFAEEMLRVGNIVPAISVEGFEEDTDFRRGKGTYRRIVHAMEVLKAHRLPFGTSLCYTSQNYEEIGSEAWFDQLVDWGAKFSWIFTYIPVGNAAVPELMATAEQRAFMYHRVREFRKTKPIFTMDFWNDGEFVGGCIAGGRSFLHINANGDIEPCGFIHYSNCNIRNVTLLEGLCSPLFRAYRRGQPFNENQLRPCPLLDNPEKLVQLIQESGARSTDLEAPEDVLDLVEKTKPAAEKWAVKSQELWDASQKAKAEAGQGAEPLFGKKLYDTKKVS